MPDNANPSETARETLRMLATRKLVPTPENYSAIYHEIAGTGPKPDAAALAFAEIFGRSSWMDAKTRREAAKLFGAQSWAEAFAALEAAAGASQAQAKKLAQPPIETLSAARSSLLADLHEQIARMAEFALPALGTDDAKIGPDAAALAHFCRANADGGALAQLKTKLSNFNHRLSFVAEDQSEIRHSLLAMLRLVFENIAELTQDDKWLHGQIELLMAASAPPLNLRRLDDVQRRLKDVIFKQTELKIRSMEAQDEMKRLLAAFLEKLSYMADLSGAHHKRIEACAKQVETVKDLSAVGPAIAEAIAASRSLSLEAWRARDELGDLQRKAEDSAAEVGRLRKELDSVSAQSRHDPLTGALNRKGLDESLEREVARARRHESSLSLAFLDIDNFKIINDIHGHPVGDAALTHLAEVARSAMRPQDTLARFGGEEFVILMPETPLEEGIAAMVRLQRELTRRFFMAGAHPLLITFSAGVAELAPAEEAADAIGRADQGMYLAKRSGKNKVVGA